VSRDAAQRGDASLDSALKSVLGKQHPVAAVALVSEAGTRLATYGTTPDADFEIGSISKGFTGLLYADAIARGEVTPDATLGDFLPLDGAPASSIRLKTLTTHMSGLPRLPDSTHVLRGSIELWRHGTNPYGETLDELMTQARTTAVGKPRPRYSNLGFELLGHALASAAATTYRDLLRKRITGPLGLEHTYAPATPQQVRSTGLVGTSRGGRTQHAWTGEAIAPAGGIRSTIGDMARFAGALLDGSAPGGAALDPVIPFGMGGQIGAAWITVTAKGREVTFHNGGTGGFRSWMGLDRHAGTGVVVLSATAVSVDRAGFRLLIGDRKNLLTV
jgi:CubicO group peptidase (beta-lactamase class C family)